MRLSAIILLLFLSIAIFAQEEKQDVLYLKNGSIIKGSVIELIVDKSIKIQVADGSIFAYPITEVEKILKETPPVHSKQAKTKFPSSQPAKGYRAIVDLGYSFGVGTFGLDRFELSFSNGYQFNPYFYLGGGLALQPYTDGFTMITAFANARASMPITGKYVPFFDVKTGYSGGDAQGFYVAFAPGVRFKTSRKCAINTSLGYSLQNMEGELYYSGSYISPIIYKSHAISLKVGFEF